jgi:hypothetical protein
VKNADEPTCPLTSMSEYNHAGLTKREEFTKAAMQGLAANGQYSMNTAAGIANEAIQIADATLAELERTK